jgi:hypothetical protein
MVTETKFRIVLLSETSFTVVRIFGKSQAELEIHKFSRYSPGERLVARSCAFGVPDLLNLVRRTTPLAVYGQRREQDLCLLPDISPIG